VYSEVERRDLSALNTLIRAGLREISVGTIGSLEFFKDLLERNFYVEIVACTYSGLCGFGLCAECANTAGQEGGSRCNQGGHQDTSRAKAPQST
jgi:hypothetical protein